MINKSHIICVLSIGLVVSLMLVGACDQKAKRGNELHQLLAKYEVSDDLAPGKRVDCLIYRDTDWSFWFRRTEKPADGSIIMEQYRRNLGAVYVFTSTRHIATIPVDAWASPFWPSVQAWDGGIALVTYRAPDRLSPDDMLPVFTGEVWYFTDGAGTQAYQGRIEALTYDDEVAATVVSCLDLTTDVRSGGRRLLMKMAYVFPDNDDVVSPSLRTLETFEWDEELHKFGN